MTRVAYRREPATGNTWFYVEPEQGSVPNALLWNKATGRLCLVLCPFDASDDALTQFVRISNPRFEHASSFVAASQKAQAFYEAVERLPDDSN